MTKKGVCLAIAILLLAAVFSGQKTTRSQDDKGWTMIFGNAQGNCVTESFGPQNPNLTLKWIFETEERYDYSNGKNLLYPFVADGFCHIQDEACNFYIVNISDGTAQTIPNNQCFGKLMCIVDGKLVFVRRGDPMNKDRTKRNNIISCLYASSREILWESPVPEGFHLRSNIIYDDSCLYFIGTGASAENEVRAYKIDKDTGVIALLETIQTPYGVTGNQLDFFGPMICEDSDSTKLIFAFQKRETSDEMVSYDDAKIFALQLETGKQFWTLTEKNKMLLSISCNSGKIVYTHKDGIACVNSANGMKRWTAKESFDTEKDISPPIIIGDKVCIVKSSEGKIKYINLGDGAEIWNEKIEDESIKSKTVSIHAATQDFLFYGDPMHTLAAIDISTGKIAWIQSDTACKTVAPGSRSDCVAAFGMLLVKSANGKLYCYTSNGNLVPKAIIIEPEKPTVQVEQSIKLKTNVRDSEGNEIPWAKIAWSVKNPKYGKIDQSGVFTAKEELGETEICATYKNLKASVKIKITKTYKIDCPYNVSFSDFGEQRTKSKTIIISNYSSEAVNVKILGETEWCKMRLNKSKILWCSYAIGSITVDSAYMKTDTENICVLTLEFNGEYTRYLTVKAKK